MLAARLPNPIRTHRDVVPAEPEVRASDTPVDYHVARDADGLWVISRCTELIGRYYSEASARALACWCAVEDAARGQPARVHMHYLRRAALVFVTT